MMVQRNRLTRLPLVGVILVGLLAGLFVAMAARKRLEKADDEAGVAKHSVNTPAEDVLKYWTEDRMRSAKPAKMPKVKGLARAKKRSKRPPI